MIPKHYPISLAHSSKASSSCKWSHTGDKLLAAIIPLAAAAGTPIPGMQLSPHTVNPETGVVLPGQAAPLAALIAGP
jgi:hypothetical protein